MIRPLALRALLALPLLTQAAQAQGSTHLNVPAKQMVWMSYQKPAGQVGWDVIAGGTQTVYPNLSYTVPAGYSLVGTDADLFLAPPNAGPALAYYGSSLNIVIYSPTSTDGAAIVVPFGYIPSYGVWNQVHLTAGTRIPSGYALNPWFSWGGGINASVTPNLQIILHGYYVAE